MRQLKAEKSRGFFVTKIIVAFKSLFVLMIFLKAPVAISELELRFPDTPSKNKPLSIGLNTQYLRTHSNYYELWKYDNLAKNNFFQYIAFRPQISYSPLSSYFNVSLFANSYYGSSKSLGLARSAFRVKVLGGGLSFFHKLNTTYMGVELRGGLPFKNRPNEILLGDDSYFVEPNLWLFFAPVNSFYVYSNLAFRYRINPALSSFLFFRLGGVLKTKYSNGGLAINSFMSLPTNTQQRSISQVDDLLKTVNGGSYAFYSIKPSVFDVTGWLELKLAPVFTTFYISLNTLGINYARSLSFGLNLKLKWNTKSSVLKRKRVIKLPFDEVSTSSQNDSTYFEEKEDSYNQPNMQNELQEELKSLKR